MQEHPVQNAADDADAQHACQNNIRARHFLGVKDQVPDTGRSGDELGAD